MDWGTLIGTTMGAVIGVSSTLLADRARWKRERANRDQELKRELYGQYLAALTRTRIELKELPWSSLSRAERAERAGALYRESSAYELRYQMSITAPERVVALSDTAFRKLRELRDRIQEDAPEEVVYGAFTELIHAIRGLRDAMRTDLGVDG